MTDREKKMKKYVNAIERRLNMPLDVKSRVMADFGSSIAARREAGQSDEEIMAELGTPQKAAADLNEQMKEFTYRKSPWRFVFLAMAAYGIWQILVRIVSWAGMWIFNLWSMQNMGDGTSSVGIIGGADGPTAVFVTFPGFTYVLVPVLLAAVGIFGYWKLKRCKK